MRKHLRNILRPKLADKNNSIGYSNVRCCFFNAMLLLAKNEKILKMANAYPKMLIARTRNDEYQYEGIKIVDLADWLLEA